MKKYCFLLLCLLGGAIAQHAAAQVPGGGGGSPGGPAPGPGAAGVPIDGGLSLLAASGTAYALRRLRQRRAA